MLAATMVLVLSIALSPPHEGLRYTIHLKSGESVLSVEKPVFIYGKVLYRDLKGRTITLPSDRVDLKKTRKAMGSPEKTRVIRDEDLRGLSGKIIQPEGEGIATSEKAERLPESVTAWLQRERNAITERKKKEAEREAAIASLEAQRAYLKQKLMEVDYDLSQFGRRIDVSPNSIGAKLFIRKAELEEQIEEYDKKIKDLRNRPD